MFVFCLALVSGFFAVSTFMPSSTVSAVCDSSSPQCCGGVETSIITCAETGEENGGIRTSGIWGILLLAINILTAGIGIAAVAGIVYGSILYTSAGGSPEQVKKAMGIITNVVIGVLAYALMYAGLNFLIPGGLFT